MSFPPKGEHEHAPLPASDLTSQQPQEERFGPEHVENACGGSPGSPSSLQRSEQEAGGVDGGPAHAVPSPWGHEEAYEPEPEQFQPQDGCYTGGPWPAYYPMGEDFGAEGQNMNMMFDASWFDGGGCGDYVDDAWRMEDAYMSKGPQSRYMAFKGGPSFPEEATDGGCLSAAPPGYGWRGPWYPPGMRNGFPGKTGFKGYGFGYGRWGGDPGSGAYGFDDQGYAARYMSFGKGGGYPPWAGGGPWGFPYKGKPGYKGGGGGMGGANGSGSTGGAGSSETPGDLTRLDLFVGRLGEHARDDEVRELFRSEGIELADVYIPVDFNQQPRGYAFVSLKDSSRPARDAAVEKLHNKEVHGRAINVEPSIRVEGKGAMHHWFPPGGYAYKGVGFRGKGFGDWGPPMKGWPRAWGAPAGHGEDWGDEAAADGQAADGGRGWSGSPWPEQEGDAAIAGEGRSPSETFGQKGGCDGGGSEDAAALAGEASEPGGSAEDVPPGHVQPQQPRHAGDSKRAGGPWCGRFGRSTEKVVVKKGVDGEHLGLHAGYEDVQAVVRQAGVPEDAVRDVRYVRGNIHTMAFVDFASREAAAKVAAEQGVSSCAHPSTF